MRHTALLLLALAGAAPALALAQAHEAVFPVEPVGKGARWEVRRSIEQEGVILRAVTLFEVIEIREPLITLKAVIQGGVEAGEVKFEGEPEGQKTEIIQMKLAGTGEQMVDLGKISPVRSKVSISMENKFKVHAGEKWMDIQQTLKLEKTIEQVIPKEAPQ